MAIDLNRFIPPFLFAEKHGKNERRFSKMEKEKMTKEEREMQKLNEAKANLARVKREQRVQLRKE